ncbi:MAG: hypothetical protein MH472_11220 [Bacteroidia bacterium]|nr:hypothetical protein [Bacteroidia bacterium]
MRQFIGFVLTSIVLFSACDEPIPHVLIDDTDSTLAVLPPTKSVDDYDGTIPGLDAKVIDYTLPNPYQHVPQLFRDSTVAPSWDDAGFPNAKAFIIFFKNFQWEVGDRNKNKIASYIDFPIRIAKDKNAFLKDFDSIFSPEFVQEVSDQNPMEIYRDKKGAMIGNDGQIWFKMIKGRYRIIEINP